MWDDLGNHVVVERAVFVITIKNLKGKIIFSPFGSRVCYVNRVIDGKVKCSSGRGPPTPKSPILGVSLCKRRINSEPIRDTIKGIEITIRASVEHHQRFAVLVNHLGVTEPCLELRRFHVGLIQH